MNKPNAENIVTACNITRTFWGQHGIQKPLQFSAFCLSLLPIPVISSAGKALDRHLSDKASAEKFAAVYAAIEARNPALAKLATIEDAVLEIAKTVESHASLLKEVEEYTRGLAAFVPDFQILTENHSYQELIHCIVKADFAQVVARNFSTNLIEHSKIEAKQTRLHASGHSKNLIHGTKFTTQGAGSIGMDGITQQGDIVVGGSSVGFGPGGMIGFGVGGMVSFGSAPSQRSGPCPGCGKKLVIDQESATHIQCLSCGRVTPIH